MQNLDIFVVVVCWVNVFFCVGFVVEIEWLEEFGEVKCQKKGIFLLVGNFGYQIFGCDDNEVVFFDVKGIMWLLCVDKLMFVCQIVVVIVDCVYGV